MRSGVAAEILFARKARAASEHLQRQSDEKIAEANERAHKAGERVAEANRKAEEERRRRADIEAFSAWTATARLREEAFLTKMRTFEGTEVDLTLNGDSAVNLGIANTLIATLITAGWKVVSLQDGDCERAYLPAVKIVTKWDLPNKLRDAAFALEAEWKTASIICQFVVDAGGTIDWAKPRLMPSGETRDASENAPMRILVSTRN